MVVRSPDATRSVKLLGLVENKRADSELPFLNHNGIDVLTESEADQCHAICMDQAGDEVYEAYQVWKAYRRNDPSNHFRIGEMQAESTAELIFVFE